jgi:hypothetical protein
VKLKSVVNLGIPQSRQNAQKKEFFMKKLLLSLLAIVAVSFTTVEAQKAQDYKKNGDAKYKEVNVQCGHCGKAKHMCKCPIEVCQKKVEAVEEVRLEETCEDRDYCEEGTVERRDKNGNLECVKTIAHEEVRKPICDRVCRKTCPTGYEEKTVAAERVEKVHQRTPHARGTRTHQTHDKSCKDGSCRM